MSQHPFDSAMALAAQPDGTATGTTSPAYWNMIGPYGGITAAAALQAVMQHPQLLGEPISLTVNYAGAMAAGAFSAHARPARTNRSTQHWLVELTQADAAGQPQVVTTATVVTAARGATARRRRPRAPAQQPGGLAAVLRGAADLRRHPRALGRPGH